jgi:hypothetical protein
MIRILSATRRPARLWGHAGRLSTFAVLALLLNSAMPSSASAERGFDTGSLRGAWGFTASGAIVAFSPPLPAVAVGLFEFDGAGTCSISDTINLGGSSFSRTSTFCSYSVQAGGTGTLVAEFPGDPGPVPLSFVIIDPRRELRFIRTDVGVASGVAHRQRGD